MVKMTNSPAAAPGNLPSRTLHSVHSIGRKGLYSQSSTDQGRHGGSSPSAGLAHLLLITSYSMISKSEKRISRKPNVTRVQIMNEKPSRVGSVEIPGLTEVRQRMPEAVHQQGIICRQIWQSLYGEDPEVSHGAKTVISSLPCYLPPGF